MRRPRCGPAAAVSAIRRGLRRSRPVRAGVCGRVSPLTMAAGFVLIVASAAAYRATVGSTQVIAAELTADHVKCFMMNAVLGTHETAEGVHREMESGFGWDAHLPEHPEQADLELVGIASLSLRARQNRAHHVPTPRCPGIGLHAAGNRTIRGIQEDFRARSRHLVGWPADVRADRSRPTRRSRADGHICSGLAPMIARSRLEGIRSPAVRRARDGL